MVPQLCVYQWDVICKSSLRRVEPCADRIQVNWPKLNPRPWATEGYQDTINKVRKDKLIGSFVTRHERGLSTARHINAEEGKKRIE